MRSTRTSLVCGVLILLCALVGSASAAPVRDAALDVASCGVDEFTGTTLDTTRWSTVVRPDTTGYSVADGDLKLKALTGDMYGDRATAKNLILQNTPATGGWAATAKLDSKDFNREGQQAGIMVYKDDRTFSKVVVINKGSQGRWFEHIYTNDQQPRLEIGVDTTPALGDSFPADVYIRVISDGETIRAQYSGDGTTWSPIGRPAKIGAGVKVGMYAADNAQDGPEVAFHSFSLNALSDEFSGTEIEKCRWSQIVREVAGGYRVKDGALEIDTGANEVDGTAPNLIGQPVPAGTWEAETKIDLTTAAGGQQAGLLLYKEPANWVKAVLVRTGDTSAQVEFVRVKDGAYQLDEPYRVTVPTTLTSFYLRMRANAAGQATAQYSTNGTAWTDIGKARDISDLSAAHLGPMALRGNAANLVTAKFDYFRVRPSVAAACTVNGTVESGFTRLWNGLDLAGTTQAGPGGFDLVQDEGEGCRLQSRGGLGLLWFNTKTYDNFVLRLQFKTADATDNSGVFVRFPNPGTDPNVAINQGHEIQIREGVAGDGEDQKTGSVYNFDRENARAAKPAGQWNDYEIKFQNGVYTMTLNGTVVNTWTRTGANGASAGYIGLQNHGTADDVSFRNIRIQELAAPAVTNILDTIGITLPATRANTQIRGGYSFKGDEMPPSNTVATPGQDALDDVPLRMPDTSGTKANFASFTGKTYTLDPADQKAFTKFHVFGTTADGAGGGTFRFNYTDGTFADITVNFADWCGTPTLPAHIAIGPLSGRYTTGGSGSDGARCSIFHVPVDNPNPTKKLASWRMPTSTNTGGNVRAYLMAMTLEEPGGSFEMPDLTGVNPFPNDNTAPTSNLQLQGEPAASGWHTTAPRITLTGTDENGGSGVEQIQYRINGGSTLFYAGPFNLTTEGDLKIEYRAIDRAGNPEPFKSISLKVDATAPTTTSFTYPTDLPASGWNDHEVGITLRSVDGAGSGSVKTEYRVNGGEWTAYDDTFSVGGSGTQLVEYRTLDVAGNTEAIKTLNVRVDVKAPTTAVLLNGADPVADYIGAVRVAFSRADGDDSSGAVATEYRVNGGEWTAYEGAFDLSELRGYQVDFRSEDLVGNVENYKSVRFTVRAQTVLGSPTPQAPSTDKPGKYAALEDVSSKLLSTSALRAGRFKVNVSCQGVSAGTLTLTVDRATQRKLKLKSSTLARKALDCGDEGRATVSLTPSSTVKKALARTKASVRAKLTLRVTGAPADTQNVTLKGKS
ncbi:DUF1080 domain-containing protein [Solirubrobacter phytolaccae]|uniref:DUF1080 domain-containing protein n=1 Tax=Solirubrobacter phytolaccae TaxID=1404360 RepID=A0A9X3S931_9ACTN|nr:family 16 glycoside hydrolase [Solirubrobacter phytolaccae]MDA0182253.1 DUF1080 domain-containing protein [Solirubrobacter phytolaccae]